MKKIIFALIALSSASAFAFNVGDSVGSKSYLEMGKVLKQNSNGTFVVKFNGGGYADCAADDLGSIDSCTAGNTLCAGDIATKKNDNAEFVVRAVFQDDSVLAERLGSTRSFSRHKQLLERKYLNR